MASEPNNLKPVEEPKKTYKLSSAPPWVTTLVVIIVLVAAVALGGMCFGKSGEMCAPESSTSSEQPPLNIPPPGAA